MEKSSVTECARSGGGDGGNGGDDMIWGLSLPPFLMKIYEIINDPETNSIISWNSTKTSFIVWDYNKFSSEILPKYFRTSIFSSFVYQLNKYGFKKISWERYEYANPWFQAGKKHWLKNVKRRNQNQPQPTKKRGRFTLDHHHSTNEKKIEYLLTVQNDMKEQIQKLKQGLKDMEDQLTILETNSKSPLSKDEKMEIAVFLKQFMQYLSKKEDEANGDNSKEPILNGPQSTESSVDHTNKVEIPTQKLLSSAGDSGSSVQEQVVQKPGEIADCPFWKKMLDYYPGFNLNEQPEDLDSDHSKAIMHLDEMMALNIAREIENLVADNPCDPGMEEEGGPLDLWT